MPKSGKGTQQHQGAFDGTYVQRNGLYAVSKIVNRNAYKLELPDIRGVDDPGRDTEPILVCATEDDHNKLSISLHKNVPETSRMAPNSLPSFIRRTRANRDRNGKLIHRRASIHPVTPEPRGCATNGVDVFFYMYAFICFASQKGTQPGINGDGAGFPTPKVKIPKRAVGFPCALLPRIASR